MRTRIYVYAFGSSLSIELGKRRYEFEGSSGEKGILHLREEEAIRLIEDHPMFKNGSIRFVEEIKDFYGAESYEIQTVRGMLAEALRQKYVAEKCEDEYRRRLAALLGEDNPTNLPQGDALEEVGRLREENRILSEKLNELMQELASNGETVQATSRQGGGEGCEGNIFDLNLNAEDGGGGPVQEEDETVQADGETMQAPSVQGEGVKEDDVKQLLLSDKTQ